MFYVGVLFTNFLVKKKNLFTHPLNKTNSVRAGAKRPNKATIMAQLLSCSPAPSGDYARYS